MMVTEVQKQRVLRRIDGFFQLHFIFIPPIAVPMRLQADGSTQHTMSNTTSPVGAVEPFDSPDDPTSRAAPERRESEKVITDWEEETRRLGRALALMTLDFSPMTGPKWAHRFIISVGRVAEDCVLLFYGARFGALMGAVAICVGICLAQSPVERGYWIRLRGQSARRRACVSMSAIRRLCAWRSDQPRAAPRTTWLRSQPRAALSGS